MQHKYKGPSLNLHFQRHPSRIQKDEKKNKVLPLKNLIRIHYKLKLSINLYGISDIEEDPMQ